MFVFNSKIKFFLFLAIVLMMQNACTTSQRSSKQENPTITKPRSNSGGMNSDLGKDVMDDALTEDEKLVESRDVFSLVLEADEDPLMPEGEKVVEENSPAHFEDIDEVVTTRESKKSKSSPPVQVFRVRFKIQNNNTEAVWYIMPYQGAVTLVPNGRFESESIGNKKVLEVLKYKGTKAETELIELRFTGKDDQHFRAFYIPAKSSFTLANYVIDCWQDSDKIELWAVKEMYVNNQRFLQDCLPFSVLSSPDVVVRCSADLGCPSENMDLDNAMQNASNEFDIAFIQAQKVKKYKVELSR